ncbi:hypothetical protein [Actinomadura coerulea]|uniref:hypothetical protein n=1 Tax=Actinomadura coerulea TaxID=46159 RepID=UPI00342C518C
MAAARGEWRVSAAGARAGAFEDERRFMNSRGGPAADGRIRGACCAGAATRRARGVPGRKSGPGVGDDRHAMDGRAGTGRRL